MDRAQRQPAWWLWPILVLVLASAPYVVAALLAPPGKVFLGSLLNSDDTAVYLSAMHQGAVGGWLYRDAFSTETMRPVMMYSLYVLWGKLTGWIDPHHVVAYHFLRLAGAAALLWAVQRLLQVLFPGQEHRPLRRAAFLLAAFSSGLGWLMAFLPSQAGLGFMADISMLELTTFMSLFVVPHFPWGLALELLTLTCFLRAVQAAERDRFPWRWSIAGGLACMGMGLIYPFLLAVAYTVLGATAAWGWVTRRPWARPALRSALPIVALPLPLVAYYVYIFGFDPLWHATHVSGNLIISPSVPALALGYGLVLALAVAGGVRIVRERRKTGPGITLLWIWALLNGAMIYAPVPFQWRFAAGWHVALSALAAWGLYGLLRRLPASRALRLRNVSLILTVPSTFLSVLVGPYLALTQGDYPFYLARGEVQAVDWLAGRVGQQDAVLASYPIMNLLPARASCRVFAGHQFATPRLHEKLASVHAFWDAATPDAERQALLRAGGITYVYHGRIERGEGEFDATQAPYLEQVYGAGGVDIYAVRLPVP